MKYSEDYIYVKNHDVLTVWNKYRPLAMIYWKKMPLVIKHDIYEYGFDEYMQDVYIIYDSAMNGVKPEKIKNPESYSLYIQLSQYLHNFTKRNIVRDYCHNWAVHYMDYEGQNDEDEHSWDSFLGMEDHHSNLGLLLEQLNDKDRDRAIKIMYRKNIGSGKLSEEAINLIKNWYSEY